MYDFNFAPQGWQCPVCRRVYSPNTPWCYFCGNEQITTTTTTTIDINKNPIDEWLDKFSKETDDYEQLKNSLLASSTSYKPKPNEKITVQG